ncbi:MAG TPA: protease inhibitor I42 family protein [Candidatus Pacearchaeota archaeon]|nr:protease inhibitor I42 family protein [Candidatus Parcubacteria bacterium]HNZ83884.1 protease inhibitor I42 family protein [Candidatus Pacearchaeota archaeon]HOU45556.1 protease inhibitor I42 family protein [Candidatus Pacearchaeota archaeon]HPM08419.1 protease inhibitor I42 family protein [Candidatus Pacearchaeota archaeon]HQI74287.1 protease inhibitor I42 family protein [Candidatus Pacearchaeota archaeon]
MDKKTFIFIILAIIAFFVFWGFKKEKSYNLKPEEKIESTQESLVKVFADEYGIDKNEVKITIVKEIGDYTRGDFKAGQESGIFLANKRDGQWLIIFSGNTPVPCTGIEKYNFPAEMIPECSGSSVDSQDSSEFMEVSQGNTFSVSLDSNPSTGYSWQAKYDQEYFELVEQKFETSSDLIGAGGKEIFIFKALKLGEKFIDFDYLRTWEKDNVEKSIVYKILIK